MKILEFASQIPDKRIDRKKLHSSKDIVFITIAAVVCGAQNWEDIEEFGHCKEEFFREILSLPNGIPSHDTFNRFFACLSPEVLEQQFRLWIQTLCREKSQLVSIDGKTIRGAKEHGCKSIFHMVSAFCSVNGLSLGQVKTDEKSNEITAIPALIEALDLTGCIITIDAMGCQTNIAETIIEAGADYILAVKNNQKELYQAIEDSFRFKSSQDISVYKDIDFGHGRIENRTCSVCRDLLFVNQDKWRNIKSLIRIVSNRYNKTMAKEEETQTRYYISSLDETPEFMGRNIRAHWGIENKLHWQLDVGFSEDASRKRVKNAAQNFSVVFKTALAMLKEYPSKRSIATKRKSAGWSNKVLMEILTV